MQSFYLHSLNFYNIPHILRFFIHPIICNNILMLIFLESCFWLINFTTPFPGDCIFQLNLKHFLLILSQRMYISIFNLHSQIHMIDGVILPHWEMHILPIIKYSLQNANIYLLLPLQSYLLLHISFLSQTQYCDDLSVVAYSEGILIHAHYRIYNNSDLVSH